MDIDESSPLSTIEDTGIGFDMSVMSMIWMPLSSSAITHGVVIMNITNPENLTTTLVTPLKTKRVAVTMTS